MGVSRGFGLVQGGVTRVVLGIGQLLQGEVGGEVGGAGGGAVKGGTIGVVSGVNEVLNGDVRRKMATRSSRVKGAVPVVGFGCRKLFGSDRLWVVAVVGRIVQRTVALVVFGIGQVGYGGAGG